MWFSRNTTTYPASFFCWMDIKYRGVRVNVYVALLNSAPKRCWRKSNVKKVGWELSFQCPKDSSPFLVVQMEVMSYGLPINHSKLLPSRLSAFDAIQGKPRETLTMMHLFSMMNDFVRCYLCRLLVTPSSFKLLWVGHKLAPNIQTSIKFPRLPSYDFAIWEDTTLKLIDFSTFKVLYWFSLHGQYTSITS